MGFLAVCRSLIFPWIFLGISASYLPGAVYNLVQNNGFTAIFSWSRVQTAWFSAFWTYAGQQIRQGNSNLILALLQGRVSHGAIVDQPVTQPLGGVVLDIGPGVGYWVDIFTSFNTVAGERSTRSRTTQIKNENLKIYGVEPSSDAHPHLKKRIAAAGLEDVYEILPLGIQSISSQSEKIDEGSVDCIISLLCLCSIPEPEKNIQELYKLLKPGGRWYVYEHVRAKRAIFITIYQRFVNLLWPHFIGGCELCRDTEKSLRAAGHWTTINLAQPVDEQWQQVVPHIYGTLTK